LPESHFRVHLALRDEQQHRLQQRHVTAISGIDIHRSVGFQITYRCRMKWRTDGHRGLQQRCVEVMDDATVARGAFGKDRDPVSLRECGAHDFVQPPGVTPAGALDEQCAGSFAKDPDERPVANLRFRDESCRARHVDHEDVQPGDVVGDE
jgi:hypothetical protein